MKCQDMHARIVCGDVSYELVNGASIMSMQLAYMCRYWPQSGKSHSLSRLQTV